MVYNKRARFEVLRLKSGQAAVHVHTTGRPLTTEQTVQINNYHCVPWPWPGAKAYGASERTEGGDAKKVN